MKKKYVNYLIKELRSERAIARNFWKSYPEGKNCKDTVVEYKLQLEIIKALQTLKETL